VVLTTPRRRDQRVDDIVRGVSALNPVLVHSDEAGVGAARATRQALELAASPGTHVLFLEDDLLVDPEAATRIAALDFPPDVGVIALCDMREVPEYSPDGLYVRSPLGSDGRGWWGNQALLIHADVVAACLRADWFSADIENALGVRVHKLTYGDEGRNCSDIRLALVVMACDLARPMYAVHVPSLFKHVGYESVCFPDRGMGERETRNWIQDRRRLGLATRDRSR
jgi:hypothetical protein